MAPTYQPLNSSKAECSFPVQHPEIIVSDRWFLKQLSSLLINPFRLPKYWQRSKAGTLKSQVPDQQFQLGDFIVNWRSALGIKIIHRQRPERTIWHAPHQENFIGGAKLRLQIFENRGSITIDEQIQARYNHQIVTQIEQSDDTLAISGYLSEHLQATQQPYQLLLQASDLGQLEFDLQLSGDVNQAQIRFATSPDEHFYGFGEQFSYIDCKGHLLPIVCEEGGIGRGDRGPKTLSILGVSGEMFSSYAPVPHFLTNRQRSWFLTNTEPSVFDLRDPYLASVRVASSHMNGRFLSGETPLELVEQYTAIVGRMPALPDWVHQGAIVGMQGGPIPKSKIVNIEGNALEGTAKVRKVWEALRNLDTPISGFWLQDWVGRRNTAVAKQLWWDWQLDKDAYPDWTDLVHDFKQAGIAVGVYVNPFLVDASERSNPGADISLYQEALDKQFLVRNEHKRPYPIKLTFESYLVDLSNPDARTWFKDEVLKKRVLGTGAQFWMADFAEAAPFDAIYDSPKVVGLSYHNQYPVDWVQVNREAILEAGREKDVWFFNRAGFTGTSKYSPVLWLGDQNTTWGEHDGMTSAIDGMVSGGFSGFSVNHSDIGGYTSIYLEGPWLSWLNGLLKITGRSFVRSEELLVRWMEMNAFTPIFRTHEGSQPAASAQFYDNDATLEAFSHWAKIYAALRDYRRTLFQEATTKGYPVVRHPILHYPDDPNVWTLEKVFMLGSEFLIAPVLKPGVHSVDVYLPDDDWIHLWSGQLYKHTGITQRISAPLGQPPVFYRQKSREAQAVIEHLQKHGLV